MGKIPSKKKKRSRDSSRRKKKRETKSKKIHRHNDCSDDSQVSSTESSSCSSSEDDYRRRKRRSKGSRKRSRRRDSSSESDDDTRRLKKKKKKKKRSERDEEYVGKKKRTRLRKRRRRDVSVSSTSSESRSTYRSESSSGESEGRKRGRSERRDEDRAREDQVKGKRRRSNDESRSCSSRGHDDELDGYQQQVRDEVTSENSSRRLRSVIVVPTTPTDERNSEMRHDEHDDYLRFRGNDSIVGAYKGELEHYEAFQENKTMEEEKDGEAMISSPRAGADEGGSENGGYDEFGEDVEMVTSRATDPENKLKGDDLETVLRARALENLRRFRGGASKETSSAAEEESLCIESAKVEESLGPDLVEQKPEISAESRDFESSRKTFQEAVYQKESESVSQYLTYPQDQSADTAKVKAIGVLSSFTATPKLTRPVPRQEIANLSSGKQAVGIQDAHAELSNEVTVNKDCPQSSQTLGANKGSENAEPEGESTPNEQSSCAETQFGSGGSDKPQGETKEGFEEKTMSVMRGGEMVQVSYKVYIPKKAPALARRKIKR